MRTIKNIHTARYAPVEDLITYSPLPSASLEQIDPFLFLNHHGFQHYKPHNNGLPFGPHPHRGMETVTFILKGDILHKDNHGHESIITEGGVQWMTAGKGLIHAEVSSREFKENGGDLEILQLWINLPARLKMVQPSYHGFQKNEIPVVKLDGGRIRLNVIAGSWGETKGAYTPLTPVGMYTIELQPDSKLHAEVSAGENIFFYIVRGSLNVNGRRAEARQLVEFNNDGDDIDISAPTESYVIFGHAHPLNEPVVAQGPFVMNTMDEIREAYNDYRAGRFGTIDGAF